MKENSTKHAIRAVLGLTLNYRVSIIYPHACSPPPHGQDSLRARHQSPPRSLQPSRRRSRHLPRLPCPRLPRADRCPSRPAPAPPRLQRSPDDREHRAAPDHRRRLPRRQLPARRRYLPRTRLGLCASQAHRRTRLPGAVPRRVVGTTAPVTRTTAQLHRPQQPPGTGVAAGTGRWRAAHRRTLRAARPTPEHRYHRPGRHHRRIAQTSGLRSLPGRTWLPADDRTVGGSRPDRRRPVPRRQCAGQAGTAGLLPDGVRGVAGDGHHALLPR